MTFPEKLQIISDIYFGKHTQSFSEDEIVSIEEHLQIALPIPLREFYFLFGGNSDLVKCMYYIAAPEELYVENNILMLAKEQQNVCSYGIHLDTQKPIYIDESNNITQPMDLDIEDFLIYLLALQGTAYFPCVGKIKTESAVELETYLFRLSKTDGVRSVFCSRNGIIGVVDKSDIFLSAKNDDCMEELENTSGLEIDYL